MRQIGGRRAPIFEDAKKRLPYLLTSTLMLAGIFATLLPSGHASAAQITARSLTLEANGTTGGSFATGTVNHKFTFTLPTAGTVGSVKFTYCTTADIGNCVTPTGFSAAGATLGVTGTGITFTSVTGATGSAYASASGTPSIGANTTVAVTLNGVVNPTANNTTFYVGIVSYAATNATGAPIDNGTVAASTASKIDLTGTMPESLIFCTGGAITKTGGVPDCTSATSGAVSFDRLFSPTDTAVAKSQFAASTNAGSGYSITVNGATLTSGGNTIPGYNTGGSGDSSVHGISKWGINLRQNTYVGSLSTDPGGGSPLTNFGADIDATSNGTTLKGNPQTGYAGANAYRFVTGESVAKSDNGGSNGPTDAQIYTASYIVNVSGSQAAGTYTTTLTYICTPTF